MNFKFLGTKIYISFLFCAILCLMIAIDRTGLILPTLFAVFVHEGGHLLAMWASDCHPKEIRLIPTSVQIIRDFSSKRHGETTIAACGPAANIVLFGTLYANYYIFKDDHILFFAALNLVIAIFNLLPVYGLDGGTLLTHFLIKFTDFYKAERIVRIITFTFAFIAFLLGVYLWVSNSVNISVFIVAIYLAVCGIVKK